jgi:hypothetical protein
MRKYRLDLKKGITSKLTQKQGNENSVELSKTSDVPVVRPVRPVVLDPDNVRPKVVYPVRPVSMSDNQYNYICYKAEQERE